MGCSFRGLIFGFGLLASMSGVEALADWNSDSDSRHDSGAELRTFCQRRDSNYDVVAVSHRGDPVVALSTSFSFECENVRTQMKERSNCFCGSPASRSGQDLVCVDRFANPRLLGSFTFSLECEKALNEAARNPF